MKITAFLLSLVVLVFAAACTQRPAPVPPTPAAAAGSEQPQPTVPALPALPAPTQAAADATAAPTHGGLTGEAFDTVLIQAIEAKDFEALRGMMGERFLLAGWRSEGRELSADAALEEMRQTVLAGAGHPAASTGMDTVALLEGADPLAFFPPDAARAVYFDFAGPTETDQALAIIGQDPATGRRYWKGMLVAAGGFRQSSGGLENLNGFSQALGDAVLAHNFDQLRAMMGSDFAVATLDPATLDGTLQVFPSDVAIENLRGGLLASGSDPVILWNTDVPALIGGHDPLAQWGPNAAPVRAMHVTSLGASNQGEAVLVIGSDSAGRLYWHGILLPQYGETFQGSPSEPGGMGPVGEAKPTSVRYVMALDELNVRSGPGQNYAVEGKVREGEIAQVSGISQDGGWWQIYCTQDSSGRCWISADPSLSQPSAAPQ